MKSAALTMLALLLGTGCAQRNARVLSGFDPQNLPAGKQAFVEVMPGVELLSLMAVGEPETYRELGARPEILVLLPGSYKLELRFQEKVQENGEVVSMYQSDDAEIQIVVLGGRTYRLTAEPPEARDSGITSFMLTPDTREDAVREAWGRLDEEQKAALKKALR